IYLFESSIPFQRGFTFRAKCHRGLFAIIPAPVNTGQYILLVDEEMICDPWAQSKMRITIDVNAFFIDYLQPLIACCLSWPINKLYLYHVPITLKFARYPQNLFPIISIYNFVKKIIYALALSASIIGDIKKVSMSFQNLNCADTSNVRRDFFWCLRYFSAKIWPSHHFVRSACIDRLSISVNTVLYFFELNALHHKERSTYILYEVDPGSKREKDRLIVN
ncbi:hypothetical protein ACJX0J_028883, partial [Zea mays]